MVELRNLKKNEVFLNVKRYLGMVWYYPPFSLYLFIYYVTEQHGYDVGVAETEDTLQAQVPAVCWTYCAQTWEEALNRASVEVSSKLRRPESIYFPPAIRASDLPSTQGKVASTVADLVQEVQS